MIIHNPILTGSFTVNGTDVSSITSSAASLTSLNSYTASQNNRNGTYATTGSNTFAGIQTVNSNLVVTGSITAQTLVVQTVTSSVVYSSGSNVFGNNIANTQVFTGSMSLTGSLTVVTTGTEFQVTSTGVRIGNVIGDAHNITGSVGISGSLNGTSATFRVSTDRNLATRFDTNIVLSAQSDSGAPESLRIYADTFRLFTATTAVGLTERLTITNGGNVLIGSDRVFGINTTDGSDNGYLALCGAGADGEARGGHIYLSGNERAADAGTVVLSAGNVSNGTINFRTGAGVERMRITNGGSIQMNYNPGGGDIYFRDTTNGAIMFYIIPAIYVGSAPFNNNRFLAANSSNITFEAGGTERIRITNTGNFNFNTAGSGAAYININQATGQDGGVLFMRNNVNRWQYAIDGSNNLVFYSYQIANNAFKINLDGSASLAGALTQNASDRRLKNNIQNIPNALDKINSINGVTFEWDNTIYKTDRTNDIGVIAQEVKEILPEAVTLAPFDANEDGTSKSGKNYLTVYYEKLIPLLIEGIKELKAEIEILKNK